jgi:hypothetical protein
MNWRRWLPGYRAGVRDTLARFERAGVYVRGVSSWPPPRVTKRERRG